jgi:hypothetical protein
LWSQNAIGINWNFEMPQMQTSYSALRLVPIGGVPAETFCRRARADDSTVPSRMWSSVGMKGQLMQGKCNGINNGMNPNIQRS